MSQTIANNAGRGVALGLFGGLVISLDIPVIRLAGTDHWTAMVVRGGVLFLLFLPLIIHAYLRARREGRRLFTRAWIEISLLYGSTNILFTLSVFATTTANLVFILAFNSMIAALLGWWMIGERPTSATWAAIAATIAGVAIIVSGSVGRGSWGDMFALLTAATLALALVRARQSGQNVSLTPGPGGLMAAAFGLGPMLAWSGPTETPAWLLANAAIVVPLSAWALALAPRYIPAPQVAMFYLLETVLAPVWVYLVFAETIAPATFAGGAVILVAIAAHSLLSVSRAKGGLRPAGGLQSGASG